MYYALLNEENIVLKVIVAEESEMVGREGNWVITDIDGISPKNYAGKGYRYDAELNAFISPKPLPSMVLNSDAQWEFCVPYPGNPEDEENRYRWDEATVSWVPR